MSAQFDKETHDKLIKGLLFNVSATSRITGVPRSEIKSTEVWDKVVFVRFRTGSRFISKKVYFAHFVAFRQEGSKEIQVRNRVDHWVAWNPTKDSSYCVTPYSDRIECSCDDYKNQIDVLGKGCCKHTYAVLGQLGHASLADYVGAQNRKSA